MPDESGGEVVATELPPDLVAWLDEHTAGTEYEPDELLGRLAAAYRAVEQDGDRSAMATSEEVDDLSSAVEAVQDDLDEKVADMRERIVQIKRETDAKAPGNHTHETIEARLTALEESVTELEDVPAEVAALERQVTELNTAVENFESDLSSFQERTEAGFENYETVLEDLLDRTDRLKGRLQTLAETTGTLQEAIETSRGIEESREQVAALKREANRMGIGTADCEECGAALDVALLTEPACPACGETFEGVERRSNFLRSHTLATGSPPALEAGDAERVDVSEDVLNEEGGDAHE
jgi:DNA repair exonuclease SbcCD ATPase subunit